MSGPSRAVFLDRDGTVVEERGYITSPDDIRILPGAAEAIVRLRARGWKVIVVSNQACVAKGMITEEELGRINRRMEDLLAARGAALDGVYCCPHHREGTRPGYAVDCDCHKPKPGLLVMAAREHGLDLPRCVMIGDAPRDIEAGRAVGAATVKVLTGHGTRPSEGGVEADHVAKDLLEAAGWLE